MPEIRTQPASRSSHSHATDCSDRLIHPLEQRRFGKQLDLAPLRAQVRRGFRGQIGELSRWSNAPGSPIPLLPFVRA